MRQSLAQIMASSSGGESPRDPAASPSEAGRDEDELLFPPDLGLGLDLDGWLEAAMTEGPDLEPPHCHHPHPSRPSNRLKAAAAARLNRQKKKQYVLGLESRLQGLAAENRLLRDRNRGLCRRLRDLERETGYLRAVLANQSALGRLLSCLAGSQGAGRVGMRLSSSLFAQEEGPVPEEEARLAWESSSSNSSDHDYALPVPEDDQEEEENNHNNNKRVAAAASSNPAGICLHVDRDQVSVEFCSLCARRAAATSTSSSSSFASKM